MPGGERFGLILLSVITGVLTLMAVLILGFGYWGQQRVDDCREGMVPGSDSWEGCSSRGDWNG